MTAPAITDDTEALAVLGLANLLDPASGWSVVLTYDGEDEYAATGYGDPAEALLDMPATVECYAPGWDGVYVVGHHTSLVTYEQRETVRVRVR